VINRRTFTQAGLASLATPAFAGTEVDTNIPRYEVEVIKDQLWMGRRTNDVARVLGQFVLKDDVIRRPYFCNVTAYGSALTRNHPAEPSDVKDHPTMHPGIWLAFGDLNGHDFWRNKAKVVHEGFAVKPTAKANGDIDLTSTHRYETADGALLARETMVIQIRNVSGAAVRLAWDSTIEPLDKQLVFGDQEEMGLGVRMATGLTVQKGGTITDSAGRKNEKEIWGQTADWCQYGKQGRGIVLMAHPDNFKMSRFHVRDYGLMVANPFAEQAFRASDKSAQTIVKPGDKLRLRYGLIAYDAGEEARKPELDIAAEYKKYVADPTK
jgi:hypothetical protein